MPYKTKELVEFYWEQLTQTTFRCRICNTVRVKAVKSGYTNLLSHMDKHDQYEEKYVAAKSSGTLTLDDLGFRDTVAQNKADWIHQILECNMAMSSVENKCVRANSRLNPISTRCLKSACDEARAAAVCEITAEMATVTSHIGLILDGWTDGRMHYVAVYAVYMVDGNRQSPLLAMAPLVQEDSQDADAHIEFLEVTIAEYGLGVDDIAFLTADNCATNGAIARKMGLPLVGCYSHKFNLAMQNFLLNHEHSLDNVNAIMKVLKRLGPAYQLKAYTELRAVLRNVTRWSSTFMMLDRFFKILPGLEDIVDVACLLPERNELAALKELHTHLTELDTITKKLQLESITIADARDLFDGVLERYPDMRHLDPDNHLVRYPDFDNAVAKVLGQRESDLTDDEALSIVGFLKPAVAATPSATKPMSLADRILTAKRQRTTMSKYIDISFIPPTSNVVERLFSSAKHILTDTRKHMDPAQFETLIFLRVNKTYWGVRSLSNNTQ